MDFNAVKEGVPAEKFILIDVRSPNKLETNLKIPASRNLPRKFDNL